jgi:hypothetical protein
VGCLKALNKDIEFWKRLHLIKEGVSGKEAQAVLAPMGARKLSNG